MLNLAVCVATGWLHWQ